MRNGIFEGGVFKLSTESRTNFHVGNLLMRMFGEINIWLNLRTPEGFEADLTRTVRELSYPHVYARYYNVLSVTRHHRMPDAAPRFSLSLAASVSLLIGSRNGKALFNGRTTLLRLVLFRRPPFCSEMCWTASSLSLSSGVPHRDLYHYLLFDLFVRDPFDYSLVRSYIRRLARLSARLSVTVEFDEFVRILVHCDAHRPIILLRQSSFALPPRKVSPTFLPLRIADVPCGYPIFFAPSRTRHYDIIFSRANESQRLAIFGGNDRREISRKPQISLKWFETIKKSYRVSTSREESESTVLMQVMACKKSKVREMSGKRMAIPCKFSYTC